MARYFLTMLPPEGRLEGGAPIGVLFGWNGDRQKKLLVARCFDNGLASIRLREDCNTPGV